MERKASEWCTFVNEDRSIWASAGLAGKDGSPLRVSEAGIKVGWFRLAGAMLKITDQRLDAEAPALESDIPCCYPTRFQATGIYFPSEGCWEVNAKAEDEELSFVVWVEPKITSPQLTLQHFIVGIFLFFRLRERSEWRHFEDRVQTKML